MLPPAIARAAFIAYNLAGPPERAGLTYDGKPVPAFEAVGAVVQHKWTAAASAAALAGVDLFIERARLGDTPLSLDELRDEVASLLTCPPYEAPAATP